MVSRLLSSHTLTSSQLTCGYPNDPNLATITQWNTIHEESGAKAMDIEEEMEEYDEEEEEEDRDIRADAYDEGVILEPKFTFREIKLALPILRTYIEKKEEIQDKYIETLTNQLRIQQQAQCPANNKGINGLETLLRWMDSLYQPPKE